MKKFRILVGCGCFVLFFLYSVCGQKSEAAISVAQISTLEPGQTIERDVATGDSHGYRIRLERNQFVKIEAEQTGCDILLALESPENVNLFEYKDDNYQNGAETQTAAVGVAGEYVLKVISFDEPDQKGKYKLKISELRPATEKELSLTEAFRITNKNSKIQIGYLTADQIRQLIDEMNTALEKFRFAGNRQYEALMLSSIGSNYSSLGDWRKATELQKKAIEINRSIGKEDDVPFLLANLGNTYLRNNEPQKALDALYEALDLANKQNHFFNQSRALNLIGNIYEETGDPGRAAGYYARALEVAQTITEEKFIAEKIIVGVLNNLGKTGYMLGENQKAVAYFQQSIELARRSKNNRSEAATLGNLGQAFFALGDGAKAAECLNEALKINHSLADKSGEAAILRRIARIDLELGKTDEAVQTLNRARALESDSENPRSLAETLLLLAKADARKGNLEAAQMKAEAAVAEIEKVRARMLTADLRDPFSANLQNYYAFYIEILMARHRIEPEKNYAALALQANERARARGLLNLLTESNAGIREGVDEKLLNKETSLKNLLAARLENLTKISNGKAKEGVVQKLKTEIEFVRAEYERARAQIRQASPRYAALTQPKILSLAEIQEQVLDADSLLLEYALGEQKSFLWLITKNDFRVVELPARREIETAARAFYEALTARGKQIKFETAAEREDRLFLADSDLQKLARELGAKILAPAAPQLANKRLLIVADGALQYVPFAALSIPDLRVGETKTGNRKPASENGFLIESNEIVSLPSASALAVLRNETSGRRAAPKTLAILADPIFAETDERFQTLGKKRKDKNQTEFVNVSKRLTRDLFDFDRDGALDLPRLPFTRREAELIGALVPAGEREKWLDFAANRKAALSGELAKYRFVHFATHGFIDHENADSSGIVLSLFDENGAERDGFLRVGDIYNLRLPAELVVLSACNTGLGKEIRGEGLIGLTRGFMYAGAKRTAVSLWNVNDEATSELMARFYQAMLAGKRLSPAAALREAQISLLKQKRWQHPHFWASFILQGEPR